MLGDLWLFDTAKRSWTELHPTNSGPGPRALVAGTSVPPTKFVVYGGLPTLDITVSVAELWFYDTVLNAWTLVNTTALPFSYFTILT